MTDQFGFTPFARDILADMVVSLSMFYLNTIKVNTGITELELFVAFDKEFGDILAEKLQKYGLSRGACLIMAIGVSRLYLSIETNK